MTANKLEVYAKENLYSDKMKEECGVFGIYSRKLDVAGITYTGLYALQHRGQESAGIAVTDGCSVHLNKGIGLVPSVFESKTLEQMNGHIAIGHVRYSTTGSNLIANAQPLSVRYAGGKLALAHNGNLVNANELRKELVESGTVFQSSTDSEVIVNLLARHSKKGIEEAVKICMDQLQGSYSLVILTEEKLIGVRDPYGIRPMCVGVIDGDYVIASESCAIDAVGAEIIRHVEPGEMVVIDETGLKSYRIYENKRRALCIFEFVYFARPDSVIDGQSVYGAQYRMGCELANQYKIDADIVISVPDSGRTAAIGFAQTSGIPFGEGLSKNRYVGRTFIQPDQKARDAGVKIKFNPIREAVKGKRVVMVDDSIVRGTTTGKIVNALREAGATEVHVCISSPPIAYPCFYGIDMSIRKELIASRRSVEEIREFIGADSLNYLSLDGLYRAVGFPEDQMCAACLNGEYIIKLAEDKEVNKFILEK